ncbi:MAG: hypothetical protein E7039_07300 [Lentisphaerae bacterium]|nr:hypothetical protein [Lentisphaerota bacterium]
MSLRFGMGRESIIPPMKMGLAGYFNTRIWTDVLDPIEVRCAVIKSNCRTVVTVQFELITVTAELQSAIRKVCDKHLANYTLLATATHCHTAPELRIGRGGYDGNYVPFAAGAFEKALLQALETVAECHSIKSGQAFNMDHCFNRRFWMKDGTVVTNPAKCSPDIVRPEGEIDPEIPLVLLENANGKLLFASISNHADTTGGSEISGDWPARACHEAEKALGKNAMCIPLIGCSGNINHFDINDPGEQASPEEAERIGSGYAKSIIKGLQTLSDEPLEFTAASIKFHVGSRELFPEELAEAQEILKKYPPEDTANSSAALTARDFAEKSPKVLRYFAENLIKIAEAKKEFDFEVSAFTLGNTLIIGLPAEPFVEIGLEIRKEIFADASQVLCSIMNNGSGSGYIPNLWNYRRGGYENTPRSNPFSIHTASVLKDICKDIKELLKK